MKRKEAFFDEHGNEIIKYEDFIPFDIIPEVIVDDRLEKHILNQMEFEIDMDYRLLSIEIGL